ncbi:DUF4293 domain-containing protein [Flavihumibacter sp. CACIAM 22H1]|uniref:DUF4293 domain-containing protein n=1 Tax=Flavihumibacter sp. CACIAM 22H1 TaxID=1812911 RepID=UPI0007A8FB2F|nr:DUF4293 domain-containing protein [Flavihumibacter sp. CACIAM 22H1]KYP15841.1 MAG: hypothetical protein A1D16_10490 [Flavihumibacter sp. CACIAM 22H1]
MIQRIQTIWLALAAICGFAMARIPLFAATLQDGTVRHYLATESLLSFALAIGIAVLSAVAIFLYKNRPTQFKLAVSGALLSAVVIGLQVYSVEGFKTTQNMVQGTYSWGGLLPIAMLIFLFLAARGIRRDEKLIKSLDRLR